MKSTHVKDSQWRFPAYHNTYPADFPGAKPPLGDVQPPPRTTTLDAQPPSDESRRGSADSGATTLASEGDDETKDMTYTSYRHPYDIKPPPRAHGSMQLPSREDSSEKHDYVSKVDTKNWDEELGQETPRVSDRRSGLVGNLLQLYRLESTPGEASGVSRRNTLFHPWGARRIDSLAHEENQFVDPDDPTLTGVRKSNFDECETREEIMRRMNYKERRKERQRMRIEFNVTCEYDTLFFIASLN